MAIVIVAIPNKDDYVWKVSSEKTPHLTLLFLGDDVSGSDLMHITEFVEHASSRSLCKFGLSVDHRGTLGDDDADVLFFDKDSTDRVLKDFRSYLLGDSTIAKAYNSVEQFPSWTPHITLGYPAAPAKPDVREYPGFHWVTFDRIALWVGDFEGPEFLLDNQPEEAYMSEQVDDFLAHFGIKGQKWGVRRTDLIGRVGLEPHAQLLIGSRPGSKETTQAERDQVAKATASVRKAVVNGAFGPKSNVPQINKRYSDAGIKPNSSPETMAKYNQEISVALTSLAQKNSPKGADALVVISPNNRMHLLVGKTNEINDAAKSLTHSESSDQVLLEIIRDVNGVIVDIKPLEDVMAQEDNVEEFLAHFGIKGMRWGVRRSDAQLAAISKKQAKLDSEQAKINAKAKKLGLISDDPDDAAAKKLSADAERFLKTRQKAGHEMSDREIKEAIQRAENIKKYNDLFAPDKNKQLADKVAAMDLQKRYNALHAELHPSKIARVNRFVSSVGGGSFKAFQALDKATGGKMVSQMKSSFKAAFATSSTPTVVAPTVSGRRKSSGFRVHTNPSAKKSKNPKTYTVTSLGADEAVSNATAYAPDLSILALPPG